MQLAISNSTNNSSTGPGGINIKYLGPLAIRYLTNVSNIALNTSKILHLWKSATIIILISKSKTTTFAQTTDPYHFYQLLPKY